MTKQYASQQPLGYENRIRNVAIVGAGGQIGKFVTASLLEKGHFKITAISREGSNKPPAKGVQVAPVDYDKPETIVAALKGQEALIITMSLSAPPDQQAKVIEAAAKAEVPWVIPNEFGGDTRNVQFGNEVLVGPPKVKARALIDSLGKSSWIGITSSFWYEYSLCGPGLFGIDIAKREVLFFDDGKQRINTSTFSQIGRAVAQVLSLPILPEDEDDKKLTLSAYRNDFARFCSFTLSQHEMFDAVKRVTGTSNADWKIDSSPAKTQYEMYKSKLPEGDRRNSAGMLYTRYFYPGETQGLYVTDNAKLGLPQEDLNEVTKEVVKMAEDGYFAKFYST